MAQLPADRTKLALAQENQVPSVVAAAAKNINAITELYDTVDLLNQKVDTFMASPTLPFPDESVTTPKLANGAVTEQKIANNAVTPQKIPNASLTFDKFVPSALMNETQNALRITELEEEVDEHKADEVRHITAEERQSWDDSAASISGIESKVNRAGKDGLFKTPSEIPLRTGQLVYKKIRGQAELVTDLSQYFPAGAKPSSITKSYYVTPTGSDANTGESWEQALASVATALAKADVDTVYVLTGAYINGKHMGNYAGARDHSIQAVGGPVHFISSNNNPPSWTATGNPLLFKYTYADAAVGVVALDYTDEYGLPLLLTQRNTTAEVSANPGSWSQAGGAGTDLFVHMPDGSAPVAGRVVPFISFQMRVSAPGVKHHHKGITFIGGTAGAFSARDGDENTVVIGEDSVYIGQNTYDGYQIKDVGLSICIRGIAAHNANDGFNYHALNGITPSFIEIDCIGINNLADGTGNGSTSHEDVAGVRINCDYAYNAGPGVADVNDAKTISINCTSRSNGPNANASGFQVNAGEGMTATMWLDGCSADDNDGNDLYARNNGIFYVRDTYADTTVTETGGTIENF